MEGGPYHWSLKVQCLSTRFSTRVATTGDVWRISWGVSGEKMHGKSTYSPPQIRPAIKHWFPLIRRAIKPLFLRGVTLVGGRLTIAMKNMGVMGMLGLGDQLVHSLKHFRTWNGPGPKRKISFQPLIFRGYVSFKEGNMISWAVLSCHEQSMTIFPTQWAVMSNQVGVVRTNQFVCPTSSPKRERNQKMFCRLVKILDLMEKRDEVRFVFIWGFTPIFRGLC